MQYFVTRHCICHLMILCFPIGIKSLYIVCVANPLMPAFKCNVFFLWHNFCYSLYIPSSRRSANRYPEPSIMRYTNARHCSGSTMLHSVACICVFVYTAFTTSFCAPSWLAYCLSGNVHTLNKQLPSAHIRHHTDRTALSGRRPFILTGIAWRTTFDV